MFYMICNQTVESSWKKLINHCNDTSALLTAYYVFSEFVFCSYVVLFYILDIYQNTGSEERKPFALLYLYFIQ